MAHANANPTHADMDDMADWAAHNPITRRTFIPQGCEHQGHLTPTVPPKPAQEPANPLQRPLASANATDPADDFSNADLILWRYIAIGASFWGAVIILWSRT